MDDNRVYYLLATMLAPLISCIGEHHGLRNVRARWPLPDTDPGHAECRHGHQGSGGAGCRALACGIPLAAVSVSPKPGQCQPQRRVDRLRSQRLPRGQGQPHWCDSFFFFFVVSRCTVQHLAYQIVKGFPSLT